MMDTKEQLIVEYLVETVSPYYISVFGSMAKGNMHKDSDIDIAFLSEEELDKYQLFLYSQELAAKLNRDVDLINLYQANTVFQAQIVHTDRVIYCSDEQKRAEFEWKALKMYAKLNEERLPILKGLEESGYIVENDVILNKVSIIERCLKRINEEYSDTTAHLSNYTKQDSIVLNLQRACEASIDLAMRIVAEKKLGLPQTSRDAFSLLEEAGIISTTLSGKMKAMVGFRNIAVHDYQDLNLVILQKLLEEHLNDFTEFTKKILHYIR